MAIDEVVDEKPKIPLKQKIKHFILEDSPAQKKKDGMIEAPEMSYTLLTSIGGTMELLTGAHIIHNTFSYLHAMSFIIGTSLLIYGVYKVKPYCT